MGKSKEGTPVHIVASPQSGEMISVGPFNLPAGESVMIMFSVTIDTPLNTPASQVCNQGNVTFTGGPMGGVLTDDPMVMGSANPTCTTLNLPDVTVTKAGPATAICGGTITYTLTANNGGTASAANVVVTDDLPDCLTNVMVTSCPGGAGNCTVGAGNVVTANVGTLAAMGSATITITATVPLGCSSSFSNSASITTTSVESNPNNNTSNTVMTTVQCPDVQVSKMGPATVVCGSTITYTLNAQNTGTAAANGVVVTDDLPDCLTNVMVTGCPGGAGNCSIGVGNVVTANVGTLAAMGSATITITATVPLGCAPSFMNQASITTTSTESNTMNNTSNPVMTTVTCPDLTINKSGPASVACNSTITYTLTVNNNGDAAANGVMVTDDLPNCLTNVQVTNCPGGAGNCMVAAGNVVTANVGTLAAMGSATITITATVEPSCVPGFSNTATVTTSSTETNPGNNTSNTVTTVVGCSDVGITKSGPATVVCGNTITYTLTVTNSGSTAADNVTAIDDLPDCLTGVMCSSSQGTCGVGAGNVVTANLGTIASSGGMATVTITATVPPGCAPSIGNTASVTTTTPESTLANNTSNTVTTTVQCPDVSLSKSGPATAVCGSTISYTLTASNGGTASAANVVVSDNLPACLTNVMITACPMGAMCSVMGNTVTANLGTLGTGGMATITITATVPPGCAPSFGNTATISTTSPESGTMNNTSNVVTTTVQCPDVTISKAGPASAMCGNTITYTLTAQNTGNADAAGVMVTDDLLDCLTGVTCMSSQGTCMVGAGNVVTANLGTLTAGGMATITVTATVAPGCGSSISNTASISTSSTESGTGNNTSNTVTTMINCANVTISKNGPSSVVCGNTITYMLAAQNAGTASAANVMVTDALPACLTGVMVTSCPGGAGNCMVAGNTVTANLGTMSAGAMATITITATVPAGCTPGFTNQASISTTSPESDTNNTSNTVMTTVLCADLMVTKTGAPNPVGLGQNLTYTVTVHNNGPGNATGVTLTDTVPAGTTFVSATSPMGWSCMTPIVGGTGTITCTKPTVVDGETGVFTIVVKVNGTACGATITNTATVAGAAPEQNTMNNTAVATTATSNSPPTANAGPDQAVQQGQMVILSGTAMDPNPGQVLTTIWSQMGGPMVTLNGSGTLMPTFTAPSVPQGQCVLLTFKLTVTDPCGDMAMDTVTVAVEGSPNIGIVIQDNGNGNCLRLFICSGNYIWKKPDGTQMIGHASITLNGNLLSFQSDAADVNLVQGTDDLGRRTGNGRIQFPRTRGGQVLTIFDSNIDNNQPCP